MMKTDRNAPLAKNTKARVVIAFLTAFTVGSLLNYRFPANQPSRRLLENDKSLSSGQGKPIMATFFEPVIGGCCGMTEEGHRNLVKAWESAWRSYGWETKVLNEADAKRHPRFKELEQKLIDADVNGYNQRCFWRWLAMAMDTSPTGGWMSDYDFFPLTLTAKIGKELAAAPGFKSWSAHVPTLLHSDHESWNRVTDLMIDTVSKDLDVEFISDMYLLKYLYENYSEEDLGISSWEMLTYSGFPYKMDGDNIHFDCAGATARLGAHLSHHDSRKAVNNGLFPKIEGVTEGNLGEHMNKRAEAASIMMKNFKQSCSI